MKITPELLKRYQENLCNEAEVKMVEKWLDSTEDEPSNLSQAQLNKMKYDIWENLDQKEAIPARTIPLYRSVMRYAAAALIFFTVGFFSYRTFTENIGTSSEQSVALKTINTQRGEKRTVTLSDGSTIRMNYETEIKVPEKFEGKERIVYLTGHAHFDVVRDTERPFIIYTEDSKTQVLGTSFDINTKEEGETEIIVSSGKVAFADKNHADNLVTLTLNNRAVLSTG
ncbi:MAG: FecR family protein, partial [Bacteroidota bacterium]